MKCPGQDSRYWKPGAIFEAQCPQCGHPVEFFKDDASRLCKHCGHRFLNPAMDFGCASYCKYAEQCVGALSPELLAQKEGLLKERVAIEMKRFFKKDFKRIGHATRVARYAEQIGKAEGGNLAVILTAAYLHDMGKEVADQSPARTPAPHQESEGPKVAREILTKLGAKEELIAEVCELVAHLHRPGPEETVHFKAVHDANLIAKFEEEHKERPLSEQRIKNLLDRSFLTRSGRDLAKKTLSVREDLSL